MYTVYNGKLINNLQDVLDVLRNTLGNEFAEVTENIVSDMVSAAYDSSIDSMMEQLDVTNEGWVNIVRDARDEIADILSKPRIDRKALRQVANNLDAEL